MFNRRRCSKDNYDGLSTGSNQQGFEVTVANQEQLDILKQGYKIWNQWRDGNRSAEIDIREADLEQANLNNANLRSADLNLVSLSKADLSESNLCEASLWKGNLRDTNLRNANLRNANLRDANLRDANLRDANLRGANLRGANLSGADLSGANLSGANLSETYLNRADLSEADLSESDLSGTNLNRANLIETNFNRANLNRADLSEANLSKSHLSEANCSGADLSGAKLSGAILNRADLSGAKLSDAIFNRAYLIKANLSGANLSRADFSEADLSGTNLNRANLSETNLNRANLNRANLSEANLSGTYFLRTHLSIADFSYTIIGATFFTDVDLSETLGLEKVKHAHPSTVSTYVLQHSNGKIPEVFLRGCGLSDWEIESAKLYIPNLSNEEINKVVYKIYDLRATQSIQISPLFISYSSADTTFVDRLEKGLNKKGVRFWRDIHDMTAGRLETQIDRAIRQNPTMLLILSNNSMNSDWVQHEVRKARELEKELGRDTLCPIALDDGWKSSRWPQRVMEQVMEYNILDFSKWEDESTFNAKFAKLLSGLDLFYKKPES